MELYVSPSNTLCRRHSSILRHEQVSPLLILLIRFYYPVAQNLSFDTTHVEWDTEAYEANATQPLLTYLPLERN
jgi:hypothetical protein